MTVSKTVLLAVATLAALLAASVADARGRHHHHHGSRVGVGVFFGAPLYPYYYPRAYYPPAYYPPSYAYYPPTVVVPAPASPPVYIEQNAPAAAAPSGPSQAAGSYWYYCRDSQAYYPYVQQCASPWQQVVPQSGPPGPQSGTSVPQTAPYEPQAGPAYWPPAPADPDMTPQT
jgi:hypothetical protein